VLCFGEWGGYDGAAAYISAYGDWSHPVTFASLFVGYTMGRDSDPAHRPSLLLTPLLLPRLHRYLQWDLCWVIYHHHAAHDWGSIIHHGIFTAMTHYVLHGWFFKKP
jgi:hypothetical protein